MVERRNGARFAFEPLTQLRVGRDVRRQHLDGNHAIEAGILGAVYVSHTSGTKRSENLVRAKASAGRQAHVRARLCHGECPANREALHDHFWRMSSPLAGALA